MYGQLTFLDLEHEVFRPTVSFNNLCKLRQQHGDIICAIHRIDQEENHSTLFFFYDGYSHECNGFFLKMPEDQFDQERVAAFFLILQSIPCFAHKVEEVFAKYVTTNRDTSKNCNFIFAPDYALMPKNNIYVNCDGKKTIQSVLTHLAKEMDTELYDES